MPPKRRSTVMNIHLLIICVISYCLAVMALYDQPVNRNSGFDALVTIDGNHRDIGGEENDVCSGVALPVRNDSATNAPTEAIGVLFWQSPGISSPQKDGSIGISLVARPCAAWTISDGSYAAVTRSEEINAE